MLRALSLILGCAEGASKKPNLIHIVMDDVGWNDLGYVNEYAPTPTIDRLVKRGIEFDRFYAFKECAPSRGSILTGRYPFHFGYYRNPNDEGGVPTDFIMLPEVLKRKGYHTHAIGKWHVGFQTREHTPTYRGFDSFFGYYHWGEGFYDHQFPPTYKGAVKCRGTDLANSTGKKLSHFHRDDPAIAEVYSMDLFVSEAKRVIKQHPPNKPLYLYLSFQNQHDPYEAPQEMIDAVNPKITDASRRNYTAMLMTLDNGIRDVMRVMKKAGLYENSIFLLNSDNGGELPYDAAKVGFGGGAGNNFPLRGGKFGLWEGSVRARAFVTGNLIPKHLRGTKYTGLMHTADIYPTLASLAGVSFDKIVNTTGPCALDGYDLSAEILQGYAGRQRKEVLHQPLGNHWDGSCLAGDLTNPFQPSCGAAITRWPYKLIAGYAGDGRTLPLKLDLYRVVPDVDPMHLRAGEYSSLKVPPPADAPCVAVPCLFNVDEDPYETTDLAGQLPGMVLELLQRLYDYGSTGPEPQPGSDDSTPSDAQCASVNKHGAWVPDWNTEFRDETV